MARILSKRPLQTRGGHDGGQGRHPGPCRAATDAVLIVEDHDLFAEAIGATLSEAGMEVAAILEAVGRRSSMRSRTAPTSCSSTSGLPDMSGLAVGRRIGEAGLTPSWSH